MKCPSCHRPVDHEAESCYSCGFSAETAKAEFGSNRVRMNRIHDAPNCMRVSEFEEISETLDHLEEKFPQILFSVYLGELGESISLGELGFWLLNQAKIDGSEVSRSNDNGILVLIDVNRREAGISLGYLPELLLGEKDCYRALMATRSFFVNEEFGSGIARLFKRLGKSLGKSAKQLKGLSREQMHRYLSEKGQNHLELPRAYGALNFGAVEEREPSRKPRQTMFDQQ